MVPFKWITLFAVILFLFGSVAAFVSCDNDDDEDEDDEADDNYMPGDDDTADDDDTSDDDSSDDDDSADDDDDDDDDAVDPTACYEIKFNLHNSATGWVYITLNDMQANLSEVDGYDFKIGHLAKVEDIDYILLGSGVKAQNLGNTDPFDDVTTAPTDGYLEDEGSNYVIGTSWQEGGSCPSGWDCTDNIYAMKLADDTYAKFTVVSAQAGNFEFNVFKQVDSSTDLSCAWAK